MVPLLNPSLRSAQRTDLRSARSLREMYFFDGEATEKMIGSFSALCGERKSARLFAGGMCEGIQYSSKNEYSLVKMGSTAPAVLPFSLRFADSVERGLGKGCIFFQWSV